MTESLGFTASLKYFLIDGMIVNGLSAKRWVPNRLRLFILRAWGMKIGDRVAIAPGCVFTSNAVEFADGSSANANCYFEATAKITVGEEAALGIGCTVVTMTHKMTDPKKRADIPYTALPIELGAGSGVGSNSTIAAGVVTGPGSVVAAGSVVIRDLEPHCLYGGVPAKLVREFE